MYIPNTLSLSVPLFYGEGRGLCCLWADFKFHIPVIKFNVHSKYDIGGGGYFCKIRDCIILSNLSYDIKQQQHNDIKCVCHFSNPQSQFFLFPLLWSFRFMLCVGRRMQIYTVWFFFMRIFYESKFNPLIVNRIY